MGGTTVRKFCVCVRKYNKYKLYSTLLHLFVDWFLCSEGLASMGRFHVRALCVNRRLVGVSLDREWQKLLINHSISPLCSFQLSPERWKDCECTGHVQILVH